MNMESVSIQDGPCSEFTFQLHAHYPKDASILSCIWPTKSKATKTSLKMPFATNNDQYAETYLFLLIFEQLSNWIRSCYIIISGN